MFKKMRSFVRRWIEYRRRRNIHRDLDALLEQSKDNENLEDILEWFVKLLQWVRYKGLVHSILYEEVRLLPVARLRYLFMVLERSPEWKKSVADNLRIVVREVSSLELYTETGFSKAMGFWGELADRLVMKILPIPPLDFELGYLFWELFPDKEDPAWLASVDKDLFDKIIALFHHELNSAPQDRGPLKRDLEDAIVYLVIQVRAIGLSPAIRHRLDKTLFRDSAFFKLLAAHEEFKESYLKDDLQEAYVKSVNLRHVIGECRQELEQVHKHLDENGVSVELVFQIARLNTYLLRIENLLEILLNAENDHKKVMVFLSKLVEENQELRSIRSLFSQNITLLARKIAERAAEAGEHYITRTKIEYRQMLQSSFGGGAVMAVAVYLKMGVTSLRLSAFMEGLFASINYSTSFVIIHFAGFTLATKQPAMTAPALAEKMRDIESDKGIEELVTEIVHLIRSQAASIFGNILIVAPVVVLIDAAVLLFSDNHILSIEKAQSTYKALDIFGPSLIYAAFTGILLWFSSIIAGWGGNWFALNSLAKTLARSPSLRAILGKGGANKVAAFLENNISAILGNVSLGFLLGMIPVMTKFIGFNVEIRHVTIAVGNLAASIPVLGWEFLKTWDFARSVIGVFFIGVLNVLVSFSLAFLIAIRARSINPPQRREIRNALVARLLSRPLSFFWPVNK